MLNYFTLSILFCLHFLLASDFVQAQTTPYTSNISSTSAQLNWTASASPTTYDVRWRPQSTTNWITTTEIPGNSFVLTGLSDGQSYEWQMRPANLTTWYGGPVSFTTTYGCSAPSLYTPNNLSVTAAQLSWYFYGSSTPNPLFTLEIKTTNASSWSSISNIANPNNSGGNSTIQNLAPGTTYVWRVRTACSPFSTTATFSTPACTVNNPRHEPQPTSAKLRWSSVQGATYTVQWRPQGGSWTTITNIPPTPYTSTNEVSLTSLTPNTTYEWQAQAVCENTAGPLTPLLAFEASCNPSTSLSLVSAAANQATVSWKSPYRYADYGYGYQLQYRPKTTPSASWTANSLNIYTSYNNTYDYYGTATGLNPNTEYEVRVQTTCPNANSSVFTNPSVSFNTTSCTNTASNLYNGYAPTLNSYYVSWSGAYENYYAVQYRPSGVTSWSQVGPSVYNGNTSMTLQNLGPGTTYEWRVVTYCTSSASAVTPSTSQTFTMPACSSARLYGFSTEVDQTTARLSWSEGYPQSGTYVVQYRTAGTETYTTLLPQTGSSVSLSGLAENTAYEWQVAVVCSASATSYSFSVPQAFTTACPNTASYLRTENNQINSINLRWDNSYLNNTYNRTFTVRYRPQGADWASQVININTYSPVLSLTGLQIGTTYEWGVARQCSATNTSAYTNGPSFSTTCRNGLNYLQTRNITATRATVSFDDSDYRSQYQLRYRALGAADWLTVPTSSRTYTFTSLTAGTIYEWQAATQCSTDLISTYTTSQTFTANCFIPTNSYASVGSSSAYFYWDFNGNISSYTLQYRLLGTTDWTSITVTSSSYSLNAIQGRYEWRLRAECENGVSSDFTPINTFATYCNTPYALTASSLNSYGATISWGTFDSGRYNLQWRASGTATWNTVTDIYQPTYGLTGLIDQTTYEIQVQAQCGNITSGFTSLTVGSVCSPPTGLSSLGFYSFESVPYQDFSWNTTPNVAYNLRWRPITGDNQTPSDWQVASDIQPSSRQFLAMAGTYEWQVQGVCVNGGRSAYVGGQPFVVSDCETKYITYKTIAEATQALLSYSAFVNSDVRWRAVGSPDWNTITNVGVQSSIRIEGLTENTAYEWQMRVQCLSGQIADYGPLQTFTTSCAPPTRLNTLCVGLNEASLAWAGPVGDFVYGPYELNWRPIGTTNWSSARVEGYIYSLTGLASATNYEWRVRAVCSTSANAGFSQSLSFYTQCTQPNALTAQIRPECGSVVLSWQGGCYNQTNYTVRVRINYGFWTDYTTTDKAYYLYNLPSGATVEYQVKSNCNGTSSLFSTSYFVYMPSCSTPASCSLVSNLSQQIIASDQATLTWLTTSSTSELRWRVVGGNWNSVLVSGTSYNLAGLANNSLYEWKVRSGCAGPNDFSSVSFFRTRCDNTFWITTITGGSESISFYIVRPTAYELRYRTGNGIWTTRTVSGNVFTLTGLLANARYEIQLRNTCSDGSMSDWLPSRFITTSCPVIGRVFADRLTETSARLNWTLPQPIPNVGLVLKYRPLGQTDWTTLSQTANAQLNPATYTLTNLSPQTTYEWLIQFDCGNVSPAPLNNQPLTFRTIGNAPVCNGMSTIQNGDWTNPAIWSCGRVPTPLDTVQVLHQVMIPDRATGRALRVRYESAGLMRFGTGARLLIGQ